MLTLHPDEDSSIQHPYQKVLPTDGSDRANQALAMGVDVAGVEGATLHLLSGIAIARLGLDVRTEFQMEGLEKRANELVEEGQTFPKGSGGDSVAGTVEYGPSTHQTILTYIDDHDIGLVVVGTHGLPGSSGTCWEVSPSISSGRRRYRC